MNLTEIIQAIEDYMDASLGVNGEITSRAKEAIEALKASCSETPNCSDCISRQAAIDAIRFGITYVKKINVETGETESIFEKENRKLENAILRVSELPSIQPEKRGDCISRRAAIDIVREECRKYTTMCIMTMNRLEKLPSMHSNPIVGKWLDLRDGTATCSVCSRRTGHYDDDNADRYCSYCGAKMEVRNGNH